MLIVPSTMELLGARNWWPPRWLDRLLPNLNIEGGGHQPPSAAGLADGDLVAGLDREVSRV